MTAIILQARLDSSRLPGKSMLPLGGRPLVFRVMEALNRIPAGLRILACPRDCVSAFQPLAAEAGFELVWGPKDNVLSRYGIAIRHFKVDRVIRATGDNPFVFTDAGEAINREAETLGADYAGYYGLPHGAGTESVAAEALLRAEREAPTDSEREHVCPYLYTHPELFLLHRPLARREWQGLYLRLTVDTKEDYHAAEKLYARLGDRPGDERYRGGTIIDTYREVFRVPRAAAETSPNWERFP